MPNVVVIVDPFLILAIILTVLTLVFLAARWIALPALRILANTATRTLKRIRR